MKFPTIILTSIALILLIISCNSSTDKYVDEKGNFSIRFGGEPDTTNEDQSFGFGTFKWKVAAYQPTEGFNKYYSVSYLDLPINIVTSDSLRLLTQLFAITQTDYLDLYGENGLATTFTKTINGYPGREFVWIIKSSDKGITRRYYLIKNRLYRMEVQYALNQQHNKEIGQFFKSFRLIKASKNPHPEKKAIKPVKKFHATFPGKTEVRYQEIYGEFGPQSMRIELHQSNLNNAPDEYGNIAYSVLCTVIPSKEANKLSEEEKRDFLRRNFKANKMNLSGKIIHDSESTLHGKWCHDGMSEMEILGGEKKIVIHYISLFEGNYMYQISVISVSGQQNNPKALRFIESFTLEN